MPWNPAQYMKFGSARMRPAMDLLMKAAANFPDRGSVKSVLDLGCGPGNITEALCSTFPAAKVLGVDSSPAMINEAIKIHSSSQYSDRMSFRIGHVEHEAQFNRGQYDLVFSNSTLHWCLDHERLLPLLINNVVKPSGGVFAIQMPDTRTQASHTLMDTAAFRSGMFDKLSEVRIPRVQADPSWYFELMYPHCRDIDLWTTNYCQQLHATPPSYTDSHKHGALIRHPVLEYTRSTGLKPIIEALGGEANPDCQQYLNEYNRLLEEKYPIQLVKNQYHSKGKYVILMPFKRFFMLCKV